MGIKSRGLLRGTTDPAFAAEVGTWYWNETSKTPFVNVDGTATGWYAQRCDSGSSIEETYLIPETRQDRGINDNTTTAATTFYGAYFYVYTRVKFNRINLYVSSSSGSPTMALGIYQNPGGGASNSVPRVVNVTSQAASSGNLAITVSETLLDEGHIWLLWGRDSASDSFAMYGSWNTDIPLHTENIPSGVGAFPTNFSTSLACSSGPPATLDPRQTGDGGDTTAVTSARTALCMSFSKV
jgi:hypothetical protein